MLHASWRSRNQTLEISAAADAVVMEPYIKQFPQKLKENGSGFLHHSNMGAYRNLRDPSMSADLFNLFCEQVGLGCQGQKLVNSVHGEPLIECLSMIAKRGGIYDGPHVPVENNDFLAEAHLVRRTQPLYERSRDKGRLL